MLKSYDCVIKRCMWEQGCLGTVFFYNQPSQGKVLSACAERVCWDSVLSECAEWVCWASVMSGCTEWVCWVSVLSECAEFSWLKRVIQQLERNKLLLNKSKKMFFFLSIGENRSSIKMLWSKTGTVLTDEGPKLLPYNLLVYIM